MKAIAKKAGTLLSVWFAHMSAYRAEIFIWMLSGMVPLIMMAVWIGKANASGGTIDGFTPPEFAAYFLSAWLTQQLIVAWVSWELDYQIRQGILSSKLLRPLDPIWEHLAAHVTEHVVRFPFAAVVITAGLLLVPGTRLTPDVGHVLAYLVVVNLAFLMRFLIAYCIGLLAFWFDQATALDELYFIVAAFLTGSFAPLSFYPPALRAAIEWLPFPYLVYYPVQVLTGAADWPEIGRVIAVQCVWIAVLGLGRLLLWRRGLRRYGAVGA
jgi:ABC-2 type transport system permease protein